MRHRGVRGVLAGRGFVLLPAASFAVHQLRYELAYGPRSGAVLAATGHGYLDSLAPWVALLTALGLGSYLARLARLPAGGAATRPARSFAALWLGASVSLLATYTLQEWLEGVFAAGHPAGLAGIFGFGGLWALPLSLLAGLLVAGLLRLASAIAEAVAAASAAPAARRRAELRRQRQDPVRLPRLSPLARRSAGRAPPAATSAALA